MKQIASPKTAMNLRNGTVDTVDEQAPVPQKRLSFLQERAEAMTQKFSLLQQDVSSRNPREAAARVPALVQKAQDAAHHFLVCAARHQAPISLLQQDPNAS